MLLTGWQVEKWAKSYSLFLWYAMFHTIKKQPLSSWRICVLLKVVLKRYTKRSLADSSKNQVFQQLCKKFICRPRWSLTKRSHDMRIEFFFYPKLYLDFYMDARLVEWNILLNPVFHFSFQICSTWLRKYGTASQLSVPAVTCMIWLWSGGISGVSGLHGTLFSSLKKRQMHILNCVIFRR